MKKSLTLSVITFLLVSISYSQTKPLPNLPTNWERVYIKNIGSFDLPPTMEIQKGKYREFIDYANKINGYDATKITAQQKGLNELGTGGFEKYARVMVETAFGSPGDFEKLDFNIYEYTQGDINELNGIFKQQFQESCIGTGLKIIEWYPLKMEKVNGMSCIHVSYKRQLRDQPYVLVHMYMFHNYDRMYKVTLSYRLSESSYWKSDYAKVLSSFRITNIR